MAFILLLDTYQKSLSFINLHSFSFPIEIYYFYPSRKLPLFHLDTDNVRILKILWQSFGQLVSIPTSVNLCEYHPQFLIVPNLLEIKKAYSIIISPWIYTIMFINYTKITTSKTKLYYISFGEGSLYLWVWCSILKEGSETLDTTNQSWKFLVMFKKSICSSSAQRPTPW